MYAMSILTLHPKHESGQTVSPPQNRSYSPQKNGHFVQVIKAGPETYITSRLWHFDPIFFVHFGQSTAAQTVPFFQGRLIQVSLRPSKKKDKILPQYPRPMFICV